MLASRPYPTAVLAGLAGLLLAACCEIWLRPVDPAHDDGTRFPATLWNAASAITQRPGFNLWESLQFRDRENWTQAIWIFVGGVAMAGAALAVLIGGAIGFTGGMTFVTPDGGGQLPPGAGAAWLGALYALFFAWPLIALAVLLAAFIAARRTWRQLKVAADFSQSP